eukprot:PhF_6_TR1531/c0_g1_i2/m.2799
MHHHHHSKQHSTQILEWWPFMGLLKLFLPNAQMMHIASQSKQTQSLESNSKRRDSSDTTLKQPIMSLAIRYHLSVVLPLVATGTAVITTPADVGLSVFAITMLFTCFVVLILFCHMSYCRSRYTPSSDDDGSIAMYFLDQVGKWTPTISNG